VLVLSSHTLYTVQAIHAFDPRVLENVDGASWKCLSGVCVNRQIIQLVPNMKVHNNLIRFICILLSFIYFIPLCAFFCVSDLMLSPIVSLCSLYIIGYIPQFGLC
jgi:hypothetical protein